ncbi:MAG: ABC transporter permease [Chitinophagaceae bacterium]|nr:ABC transporter permease [Chitinophagaceae bacterium]
MLKNYIIVAWRNLLKNKVFSLVNIVGLATGLTCFLLITLYVFDELSYDNYNEKADRIYRINSFIKMGGSELKLAVTSDMMGQTLKKDLPQVEEYVRFYNSNGTKSIRKNGEYIVEPKVAHADSTLFRVFTLPALYGDTKNALNEPNTVVITESAAKKYFGEVNVVGKTIETNENGQTSYRVTAVIRDVPHNSHFDFDLFFSMDNVNYGYGNYLSHNFQTYILLKEGTTAAEVEKQFPKYIESYVLPQAKLVMQINSMQEFRKSGNNLEYSLIPLLKIHLHSDLFPELGVNGDIKYVYIFSAAAIFILLLACINFINLSTARSMSRSREVGIRKVLGTSKTKLVVQFLSESGLTVVIAMVIAIVAAWQILPLFNTLSAKSLSVSLLFSGKMLATIIILPFIVSLLAGSYPSLFLSSFNPVMVLKGKSGTGSSKSKLRNGLVIFQFATSIVLIIATITVYRQLDYIQTRKIGFNKDQVLVIDGTGVLGNSVQSFKNEIAKLPGVLSGTYAGFLPVAGSARNDNTFSKEAVLTTSNTLNIQSWSVDEDYIPTLGMEIKEGRNFSKSFGTDSSAIIINETAASLLGYKDPVGKKLYTLVDNQANIVRSYDIVGVVKNFNYESLRQRIGPLAMVLGQASWSTAFRVKPSDAEALINQVSEKWKSMSTGTPFSYHFLDESFDNMYRAEQQVGRVAVVFAVLAVIIACLGLFGLATYMAEQRTKEIGVRKVLGASVNNIVMMLSRDFLLLILAASLIAFPVAWWAMSQWLQDFEYRIGIGWWIFLISGSIAIVVALCTISFQAVRAALANPVKSLRTE